MECANNISQKTQDKREERRYMDGVHTSTRMPLNAGPMVTEPSFTRKSPASKRGPRDSIFVCFFAW